VQLLPVNDHLVPAQFDEPVLGQEAEEGLQTAKWWLRWRDWASECAASAAAISL
jgi:hypothetical protein